MKKDLISIIIPVYNVQDYLDRCIKSVLNQTYKNIEIILVDDGSTDNCLEICKKYTKDKRVKVYHKKNGGLSSARNYGMTKMKGDYIYFLDSDDYICSNTIDILYNSLIKNKADISCGKEKFVYNSYTNLEVNKKFEVRKLDSEEALENILYMNFISNSACNKLYKKELFNNVVFPEGKLYEDLGTIYKVVGKAKKIIFNDAYLYNYFIRNGSITHSLFRKSEMITLDFCEDIIKYVENNFPNIIKSAYYKADIEAIMLLMKLPIGKEKELERKIKNIIKKYNISVIIDPKVKLNWKISCISIIFGRYFAKFIWNFKLYLKKILK